MNLKFRSQLMNWLWMAILLGFVSPVVAAEPVRPNFLVILCDDLGYGDLGCFGHPTIKTPNLDALAKSGARLTDCYSAAPVCSSSRCGLLTGRNPTRLGIYDWIPENHRMHLAASEITVATLLRDAGYATCHVGKWHCNGKFNSSEQPQPGDHGFDHWYSTQNNAAPSHHNPNNFVSDSQPVGALAGYSCHLVADEAIRWLKEVRKTDRPFFQFVCFHEPHEPIASPPELVSAYASAAKTNDQAEYFANVANMDQAVGRLLAALDDMKLADNTLVLFTSDNGPETLNRYKTANRSYGSASPLRGMKLHIYDGGIRVPGILRSPSHLQAGQTISEPVCSLDILPTFCELAGIKPPEDRALDGASFTALFKGEPIVRSKPLFWHYYRAFGKTKAALRDGDWMIVGLWDGQPNAPGASLQPGDIDRIKQAKLVSFELYNLREDIGQQHDLSKEQPDRLRSMQAALVAAYTESLADGPTWKEQ